MQTTGLLTLVATALVGLAQPVLAVPRGDGGSRGSFGGGHVAGGFSPGHIGGFAGGGARAAPTFSPGGARFRGGSMRAPSRAPQQFYYYSGARTSGLTQHAFVRQMPNRSSAVSRATTSAMFDGQQNRARSLAKQNTRVPNSNRSGSMSMARQNTRVANPQAASAAVRHAIADKQVLAHHDANWHRDWDKHRLHFHNNLVFVFVNGFWWGLYPCIYYPYYGYGYSDYPYDDSYGYPYDYGEYPYDGADYSPSQPYSYYSGYAPSGTNSNGVVSAVQSKLASSGYYQGAIDGILGDETEAAIARYQQDYDLSVTGTLTAETLHALELQ